MSDQNWNLAVPQRFTDDLITRTGEAGKVWLKALPQQLAYLSQDWGFSLDGPVMHGYTGLAIPVRRGSEPCVLKLYWRERETDSAPLALKVWDGRGAVQVLEHEPELGAVLLERLDPNTSLQNLGVTEAIAIAGRLLHRLSVPAPAGFFSLQEMATGMATAMSERWQAYGQPFERQVLEQVCEWARELGAASQRLLVDYDLHYVDILAGQREPWLMIDPKPVAGDPEFCPAQLLWTRLEEIEAERGIVYQFQNLVEVAELDAELTRKWTMVRCADYWLWCASMGFTVDPARCERIMSCLSRH